MTGDRVPTSDPAATSEMAGAARAVESTLTCPKCGRECRASEPACVRCGLLASHFDGFAAAVADAADPPALEAAWQGCAAAWDSPAAHERALSVAVQLESLPALARRYRRRLEAGPDEVAARRLQQIALLMEATIRSHSEPVTGGVAGRAVWLLGYLMAGVVLLASAWLCLLALRHHG